MKATKQSHDWHCNNHDTYGWRGEECKQCTAAPYDATSELQVEIATLKEKVTQLEFRNERLVADYTSVQEEISTIRRIHVQNIAIKDAEIARWKTVPMKYRRMEFNAQLQAENAALKGRVAQLEREKEYRYVEQIIKPIRILLKVAECAESMADNSEEMEGEDGRIHVGTAADFDELSDALDLLDELPDDKPGYVLGGAAKAAWALHDIIGDTND